MFPGCARVILKQSLPPVGAKGNECEECLRSACPRISHDVDFMRDACFSPMGQRPKGSGVDLRFAEFAELPVL